MKKRQFIAFLRQYNDIDQMTPVLWKLSTTGDAVVHVVITTQEKYLDDSRIRFLAGSPDVHLRFIDEFLSEQEEEERRTGSVQGKPATGLAGRLLGRWGRGPLKTPASSVGVSQADSFFARPAIVERILNTAAGTEPAVVLFDWTQPVDFVLAVLAEARKRSWPTVSLPHGDSPYCNLLENKSDLNYGRMENYRRNGTMFDYVVVPNALTARRYNEWLAPDRLKVLGSPRYNDEWMGILSDMTPSFAPENDTEGLKIALFLRPKDYAIHWEEVITSMRLVMQFPDVRLVIKHHTRESSVTRLMNAFPELRTSDNPRIEFALNDAPSGSVIRWADVIMDLGTSATFEAVKLGKPVLALEYLQANYLTISSYMPECEMKCRDHLYDAIAAFIENPRRPFYDEMHRQRFIQEVIGPPEADTLAGYVDFLSVVPPRA